MTESGADPTPASVACRLPAARPIAVRAEYLQASAYIYLHMYLRWTSDGPWRVAPAITATKVWALTLPGLARSVHVSAMVDADDVDSPSGFVNPVDHPVRAAPRGMVAS